MFSKFLLSVCCAFSFVGAAHGVKFKATVGRISYILNSANNTASINKVYAYWPEDLKVSLPAFVKYDDTFFKVIDVSPDAFKTLALDISEINVPHTINKTEANKNEYFKILKNLDEVSKVTIKDYFKS